MTDATRVPYQLNVDGAKFQKSIAMIPQSGEFHRMIANLCSLAHVPWFFGSLEYNKLQFSTRPGSWDSTSECHILTSWKVFNGASL